MRTHQAISFNQILAGFISSLILNVTIMLSPVAAQEVLFDFNNAPIFTSLPIYQTSGGITAHLLATGQGYSIQNANVMGFTPPGFNGRIIYPNSINLADLIIGFDQTLTDFSIMYACQELGCDDAATMKVTAFMNGAYVGFSTRTATFPGTWPVDTLRCIFPQGFDSVVVHYNNPPPTCQDYGTIFMADNMRVTASPVSVTPQTEVPDQFNLMQNFPNPFNPVTTIKFSIQRVSEISLRVYDVNGSLVSELYCGYINAGIHEFKWNAESFASGVYYYELEAGKSREIKKMVQLK